MPAYLTVNYGQTGMLSTTGVMLCPARPTRVSLKIKNMGTSGSIDEVFVGDSTVTTTSGFKLHSNEIQDFLSLDEVYCNSSGVGTVCFWETYK